MCISERASFSPETRYGMGCDISTLSPLLRMAPLGPGFCSGSLPSSTVFLVLPLWPASPEGGRGHLPHPRETMSHVRLCVPGTSGPCRLQRGPGTRHTDLPVSPCSLQMPFSDTEGLGWKREGKEGAMEQSHFRSR